MYIEKKPDKRTGLSYSSKPSKQKMNKNQPFHSAQVMLLHPAGFYMNEEDSSSFMSNSHAPRLIEDEVLMMAALAKMIHEAEMEEQGWRDWWDWLIGRDNDGEKPIPDKNPRKPLIGKKMSNPPAQSQFIAASLSQSPSMMNEPQTLSALLDSSVKASNSKNKMSFKNASSSSSKVFPLPNKQSSAPDSVSIMKEKMKVASSVPMQNQLMDSGKASSSKTSQPSLSSISSSPSISSMSSKLGQKMDISYGQGLMALGVVSLLIFALTRLFSRRQRRASSTTEHGNRVNYSALPSSDGQSMYPIYANKATMMAMMNGKSSSSHGSNTSNPPVPKPVSGGVTEGDLLV